MKIKPYYRRVEDAKEEIDSNQVRIEGIMQGNNKSQNVLIDFNEIHLSLFRVIAGKILEAVTIDYWFGKLKLTLHEIPSEIIYFDENGKIHHGRIVFDEPKGGK